jgi:hypothetical protein
VLHTCITQQQQVCVAILLDNFITASAEVQQVL